MHIHITLIGEQWQPVLTVVDALVPDKIVAIYSSRTKSIWDFIKVSLDESICSGMELDATNSTVIKQKFDELAQFYAGADELTVNISSGTKAWSFFAQEELRSLPNVKFYYIDQKNILYNLTGMTSGKVEPFAIDRLPSTYKELKDYTEKDDRDIEVIEAFRGCGHGAFRNLTKEDNNDGGYHQSGDMSIEYDEAEHRYKLSAKGNNPFSDTIDSPNAKSLLFNFGWFEFKVARFIEACSWQNANGETVRPTDIWLNNVISNSKGATMNEIDIRFNADGRQFFVEVKTSIHDTTDLDKFNTVVNRVAGRGALKLFITEKINDQKVRDKCLLSGIVSYETHNKGAKSKKQRPKAKTSSSRI